eukprot:TRINITY_DN28660_c0_g1_i1.p1 TRINITY_DN28660_c0_g1~~TRINITY_DN28660_c0_g1_i1.p1  ORF type:complete len:1540 (+),score=355.44 TRINITY_DN28660_c0_g1_i1:29-4621(+)
MFDWDNIPDDVANYVAIEQPSSGDERESAALRMPRHEETNLIPPASGRCYSIGGVSLAAGEGSASALVPDEPMLRGLAQDTTPSDLAMLRWMMQKVTLGQDMFLLGPPGARLRHLVLRFCSLFRREMEYVGITRDTNESDLKQRREIRDGEIFYFDQPPVRAALRGRILVLEGVEKAERNVLPLLNNLLENREMQLEDGRFLLAPERLADIAAGEDSRLVPVHPNFIVVAIGMPSRGQPLDPPLRSRFSAHSVWPLPLAEAFAAIPRCLPAAKTQLRKVMEVILELQKRREQEAVASSSPSLPALPEAAALESARLLELFPALSPAAALRRAYPCELALRPGSQELLTLGRVLTSQGLSDSGGQYSLAAVKPGEKPRAAVLTFDCSGGGASEVSAPAGGPPSRLQQGLLGTRLAGLRLSATQAKMVSDVLQDHSAGFDVCLVGEKGVGKTALTRAFSELLGYHRRTVFCFKDLLSRDLLQRRSTDARGNTEWRDSPLVQAAVRGELAVLDGIQRLPAGSLYAALGPLLLDREAVLPDGSRLVAPWRWPKLIAERDLPDDCAAFEEAGVSFRRVHPAFRCIATAEPPAQGGGGVAPWLDEEVVSLFHFHGVLPLPPEEQLSLASSAAVSSAGAPRSLESGTTPSLSPGDEKVFRGLLAYGERLRSTVSDDPGLEPLRLTLRVLLRVACHLRQRPGDCEGALNRAFSACLRFLPSSSQEAVNRMLIAAMKEAGVPVKGLRQRTAGIAPDEAESKARQQELRELENVAIQARMFGAGGEMVDAARVRAESERAQQHATKLEALRKRALKAAARQAVTEAASGVSVSDGLLHIGDVRCPVRQPQRPELVPAVSFVDIPQHVEVLKDMLLDWTLGHHLLLVGNQGVGKNKLTDRLLGLLGCEREYVQLHRDTTVQSLTLAPSLKAGVVVWEDSPLLRAVKEGRCLVVDEADKAPVEVVCVLKALCDDGELSLPDGRTIVAQGSPKLAEGAEGRVVEMSSEFRMIVLANRPGYPFLGHDFYRVCGDVFSCHVIDNPDIESEVALLRSVGPHVPKERITQLSLLFAELRDLVEAGQLAYPYSTRELVKLVAHAERFPKDQIEEVAASVFAFDVADSKKRRPLLEVLQRHGIAKTKQGLSLLEGRSQGGDLSLRLDEQRDKSKDITREDNADGQNPPEMREGGPKHGEWDGQEHIGGNMFAGGSGGTGTAGLGGRWGPYRLDVGQKLVHVPEDKKQGLDEATKKKTQQMADEAYKKRLAEMNMTLKEGEAYASLRDIVATQIQEMKVCLEARQAQERERQWLKNQTHGELDDSRIVDGITGSKTIYVRRGEPEGASFGGTQQHPKRITFVMDISGSMYTFNRIDRRLQRLQEVAAFIFESFSGFEAKYDYRMVGHSGTGPEAERLVEWGKPPRSDKERLAIAKTMEAHAQFCYPGDHTLEATERAITEIGGQPADERLVLVVSDADLQRYNIDVRSWNMILQKDPGVKAYVILISNNASEAERIKATLAPGRAHICAEASSLAVTFKQIFQDSLLRDH